MAEHASATTAAVWRTIWCAAVLGLAACSAPVAPGGTAVQWAPDSATIRVAPGPQYTRGSVWRFFWGAHYRTIWAVPVSVPVLRLATAEPGGLTPLQAGGSYQSRTLRLRAPNGREFVLRSVDKDASMALPAGLARRLLGGLMRDQTCATQPYGAYIAAPLAEAARVYHANPRLVYLPDDSLLRQFRPQYANALYLLEERPDGNQQGRPTFGHSPQVVSTAHMLTDVHQRPNARVEARAYLRARLLDMWLGDWSRREDQWRWASFPQAGRVVYRPIPRDRDQAFFLFNDGAITRLISWFVPKYHSFQASIPLNSVDGLTTTARVLDRTLLGRLSAEDFRQEADSLRLRLTDAAIKQALEATPAETRSALTARFAPMLSARRAQLPAIARRYYEVLAAESWLVGTDQAERFVISQTEAGALRVRVLARRPQRADSLLTERLYTKADTRDLRLFGLGGNDVFELQTPLLPDFSVSLYDGDGDDHVQLRTDASAEVSGFTWFRAPDDEADYPALDASGLIREADPHPELSTNVAGWRRRYRLRD
ncbi:MAG TPA: hypothetical protein VF629_17565 [Hymenobacter sp.]|uniref:hypothetical protein n=1 Tax=Hymenobacter sp. TaxID=1898978 RepID=UPI002EDB3541